VQKDAAFIIMGLVITMRNRKDTRAVKIKSLQIGGQEKVVLQTMLKNSPKNVEASIKEIRRYMTLGAELLRVAVSDQEDAKAIAKLKEETGALLVADIHFDHRLALIAIESGVDKIRLNPGNIHKREHVEAVVKACKKKSVPIRIGINAGSLEKDVLRRYGKTAKAMVESAKGHVAILEALDFYDIVLSFKASDVPLTIAANLLAADIFPYPLHLGVTEAGMKRRGTVASSAGIGTLLYHGVGDTIRVSLTGDRGEELKVAKTLLGEFGLYKTGKLISCPTCGRIAYDMEKLTKRVEEYLEKHPTDLTIAVMGCAVNGPEEAKDADVGVAGGKNEGLLFVRGNVVKKVPEPELFEALVKAIKELESAS